MGLKYYLYQSPEFMELLNYHIGYSRQKDCTLSSKSIHDYRKYGLKAWKKAIKTRAIIDNHIFHSDRGIQYASTQMQQYFKNHCQSMSRKGNYWDNAVAESFFKTIKYECLNKCKFDNQIQLHSCINDYMNWYNYQRLHSSLGYLTPAEMELKIKINQFNNVA